MLRSKPYDISYDGSTGCLTWFVHDSLYQINAIDEYNRQRHASFIEATSYFTDEYDNKSSHYIGTFEDYDFEPDWSEFVNEHTTEQYLVDI